MTQYLDKEGLKTLVTEVKKAIKAGDDNNIPNSQKGVANGIATLDSGGKIPIAQLGNLDTTVAEVVASLPTTGIKKHIYMVKASSTSNQNIYKEYIYTGDTSAAYDASKWEQLGEYKAEVDLSGYLTKTDASNIYVAKSDIMFHINLGDTLMLGTDGIDFAPGGYSLFRVNFEGEVKCPKITITNATSSQLLCGNGTLAERVTEDEITQLFA